MLFVQQEIVTSATTQVVQCRIMLSSSSITHSQSSAQVIHKKLRKSQKNLTTFAAFAAINWTRKSQSSFLAARIATSINGAFKNMLIHLARITSNAHSALTRRFASSNFQKSEFSFPCEMLNGSWMMIFKIWQRHHCSFAKDVTIRSKMLTSHTFGKCVKLAVHLASITSVIKKWKMPTYAKNALRYMRS